MLGITTQTHGVHTNYCAIRSATKNAADEMKSEEREDVKVQLHVMYSYCVPCPAGTCGGLCQHIFALLILLQHHVPESSSPAASLPGLDSVTSGKKLWGGQKKDVSVKTIMETMVEGEGSIRKEEQQYLAAFMKKGDQQLKVIQRGHCYTQAGAE